MKNLLPFYLLPFFLAFVIINSARAQAPDSALVELPDQRTFFSKTYYNAKDNTYIAHISAGYRHYQATDGSYRDIDTHLQADSTGAYRMEEGLYRVRFGQRGGDEIVYELPRPVQRKFRDPGKPPAPLSRLSWKIRSLGYYDSQRKKFEVIQNAGSVTPVVANNEIRYPQIFNGIDVNYTCESIRLKEELVLSQTGREALPDPAQFGMTQDRAFLMLAVEFDLKPGNIRVFARKPDRSKVAVKQTDKFAFEGDDPIEFEDDDETLHFFFPQDFASAEADSLQEQKQVVRRVFYTERGKHVLLAGVPYSSWLKAAPAGTLIIDPTVSPAATEDVWLEGTSNKNGGSNAGMVLIGKAACCAKKRTIIKFNIAGSGIPGNATVLNAQMKMYYFSVSNGGSGSWVDRWVQVHQLLVNWDEAQATSVNRLTGTPWNVAYVGLNDIDANDTHESTVLFQQGQTNTWKSWDVTALTQKWVNGSATNYGVVLWATNEGTDGYDLRFRASEYTTTTERPYLQVTYSTSSKTVYFLSAKRIRFGGKDHLGSIRATVDNTGAVVGYDDYDPWGLILVNRSLATPWSSVQGAAKNKFTGKEWDDEFGLNWNYFGARYYDPQIGRFPTVDPMAYKHPGWSPYNYVLNNPLILIDPDGRQVYYNVGLVSRPKSLAEISAGLNEARFQTASLAAQGEIGSAFTTLLGGYLEAGLSLLETFSSPAVDIFAIGAVDDAIRLGQKSVKAITAGDELSSSVKNIFKKIDNIVTRHLKPKDITGAIGDIQGKPITIGEKTFDHLREVQDAQRGLVKQIDKLKKALSDPNLSKGG